MRPMYMTPCVTAMNQDETIDFPAQAALYNFLVHGGIDGVLVMGSMGEFFALTQQQRRQLAEFSVQQIAGRVKVIIGTNAMRFEDTVQLSRHALHAGADAVAVISPYYLKLTQEELIAYYDRLADQVDGPLYLYNYPDRTAHSLDAQTVLAIRRRHANVIGIKDSASTVEHTLQILEAVHPEFPDFEVYCGFDNGLPAVYAAGGSGAIGGLSNVAPALIHQWCEAVGEGDEKSMTQLGGRVNQLMRLYDVGMPFSPYIKEATRLAGVPLQTHSTFPLPAVTQADTDAIARIMTEAGLSIAAK